MAFGLWIGHSNKPRMIRIFSWRSKPGEIGVKEEKLIGSFVVYVFMIASVPSRLQNEVQLRSHSSFEANQRHHEAK